MPPEIFDFRFFREFVLGSIRIFSKILGDIGTGGKFFTGVIDTGAAPSLKKILERGDQYLYVARRTFTNLFLRVNRLNFLRAVRYPT